MFFTEKKGGMFAKKHPAGYSIFQVPRQLLYE